MAHMLLNTLKSLNVRDSATGAPGRRSRSTAMLVVGFGASAVAVAVVVAAVDGAAVRTTVTRMLGDPAGLALGLGAFGLAFVLRAIVWSWVLPELSFGQAWAGVHVSLAGNHVLPLRLGEPLRVVSVVRRAGVPANAATASTVVLRMADLLALGTIALVMAPTAAADVAGWWGLVGLLGVLVGTLVGWRWLVRLAGPVPDLGERVVGALMIAGAWLLEAVLVYEAARWAGLDIAFADAVVVGTVAVAAQTVAIAPGGFGTYEAAAVAAYVALGYDAEAALAAALATHAAKTAYSVMVGGAAFFAPAPGFFGRFRVAPAVPRRDFGPLPQGHIVLVMPANNEVATVAELVRRAPAMIDGRPVEVVVVDDGSTDGTAAEAAAAGATVVVSRQRRGLGAAVRTGLAAAVSDGAAVVAFCDADGEYAPEHLAALVAPILGGRADYVVGSRFAGTIEHMRPHRRLGNQLLTRWMRIVSRTELTDGQSGYRALSADAARSAEIVHDYNYAQVLTLDLLGKGFRYAEVPITYRFRTEGRSFVRLGPYLRRVLPAVHRELNMPETHALG